VALPVLDFMLKLLIMVEKQNMISLIFGYFRVDIMTNFCYGSIFALAAVFRSWWDEFGCPLCAFQTGSWWILLPCMRDFCARCAF